MLGGIAVAQPDQIEYVWWGASGLGAARSKDAQGSRDRHGPQHRPQPFLPRHLPAHFPDQGFGPVDVSGTGLMSGNRCGLGQGRESGCGDLLIDC